MSTKPGKTDSAESVLSLIRRHPAAQEILEDMGIDPWEDPSAPLQALCARQGIGNGEASRRLASIEEPAETEDWRIASLPRLLEYLVRDHERILKELIPGIEDALARALSGGTRPQRLESLSRCWPGFVGHLAEHVREEEAFLFPRILHYGHCVRHRNQHPDFTGGSVNVFIAIHLMGNEARMMEALDRFLAEDGRREAAADTGPEADLRKALDRFRERIRRHSRMETEILYPRAKALEKSLYDAAISGWS